MCMVAILLRVVEDYPVVVAANREEHYDRQGTPPQRWNQSPPLVAGRDPQAGGTWLGANPHGLLAAITNRPKQHLPANPPSRGILCRDLLQHASADQAHHHARDALAHHAYAGCNVVLIDRHHAYIVEAGDGIQSHSIDHGIHVVTAPGLNRPDDARSMLAREQLANVRYDDTSEWLRSLASVCGTHGDRTPICLHGRNGGTISSSIIAIANDSRHSMWLHAQGPPCRTPFSDYSEMFRDLLRGPQHLDG